MIRLQDWLALQEQHTAPLLDTESDELKVHTHQRGRSLDRRTLTRHPTFDRAMIEMVAAGLDEDDWQGFLYVMHTGQGDALIPRYIGKAEKKGVKHPVSANLVRLHSDPSKFGRWGYNKAYHVGELSHAVFGEAFTSGKASANYLRWAAALFVTLDPPVLRAPLWMTLIPWRDGHRGPSGLIGSLAAVEYEVIALAAAAHPAELLNVQGR
ncbi:hypothetical protein [Deinococcus aquaticus]|uniref:hypothetical protein n=1 Tax=Deinococcus aquaticus TaxID=328692 RepID=UPI003F462E92